MEYSKTARILFAPSPPPHFCMQSGLEEEGKNAMSSATFGSYSPHPFRSLVFKNPGLHVILVERCWNEDLSAVLFIPGKLILNCPVETTYCIWNRIASLFSSMSSVHDVESITLTVNENRIFIASCIDLLVFWLAVQPHSGTVTSFNLHALELRHPVIVESVLVTSCSNAWCRAPWLISQWIPGNLIEKLCSISFGFALPVEKGVKFKRNLKTDPFKTAWFFEIHHAQSFR